MNNEEPPPPHNDPPSAEKKPSRRSRLTIVLALLFIILAFFSGRMSHRIKSLLPRFAPPASDSASIRIDYASEIRRYNNEVSAALDRHLAALDKIAGDFEQQLRTTVPARFDEARAAIPEIKESFAGFKTMGAIVKDGALDKVNGGDRLQDRFNAMLEKPFTQPCARAGESLIADYDTFAARMNAEDAAFREELASAHGKLPDAVRVASPIETLRTNMEQTYEALEMMPLKAGLVAFEVAIEAALIKTTIAAVRNLVLKFGSKTIAKGAASAAAPAADGPLPVGDVIAIGGFIWTGIDIVNLTKVLPNEIGKSLNETVDTLQAQTIDAASKAARETRAAHEKAARELAAAAAWNEPEKLPEESR